MRRPAAPLFLARAVYRQRRLRDAARLLSPFGFFLLMLPLLWRGGVGRAAVYVFGVWVVLIGLAAYLAPRLSQPEADSPDKDA